MANRAWSYLAGEKGRNRVRVFDWNGKLWIDYKDGARRLRQPLPFGDRTRAKVLADEVAALLADPSKCDVTDLTTCVDGIATLGIRSLESSQVPVTSAKSLPVVVPDDVGDCYLYVVRRPDTGSIKIGRATDVAERFSALQSSNDVALELLLHFRADPDVEIRMHARLARHRRRGEWYHPTAAILEWIERQSTVAGVVNHAASSRRLA